MSAYPGYAISKDSRATPEDGLTTEFAEDLTVKQRTEASGTRYFIRIIEEWITIAEFVALVAAYNLSLGPYDVTINGQAFSANFTGEPFVVDRSGPRVRVEVRMVGVRA